MTQQQTNAATRSRFQKTDKPGIYRYHSRKCEWPAGSACSCEPTFQATAYDRRTGRVVRKSFPNITGAKTWKRDEEHGLANGTLRAPAKTTVGEALDAYIAGIESGAILNRSNRPYKPAAIRSYRRAVAKLKPELGYYKLSELQRRDVKALAERLRVGGASASTVLNALDPLRAVYRRAIDLEDVVTNPTANLGLPTPQGQRDRTAAPAEAEALIEAVPQSEQALWAFAIYVGLRRGELQELRWSDLDLDAGIGRCERAWDDEGRVVVNVKSDAGERWFPLVEPVRRRLAEHQRTTARMGVALVFGETSERRFVPSTVRRRARKAWEAAGLEPLTLHEGRHSAATAGSSAGLDDLALAHVMGHSSVVITRDRYGHVRPDRIMEVTKQLDAYYERAAQ